ncbi:hypothetical protein GGI43DRAFT_75892 [Trichoderma evansii]
MAIVKPAIGVLPSFVSPLRSSHHVSHCARSSASASPLCNRLKRRYATANEAHEKKWSDTKASSGDRIPEWPKSPRPTPYEVLGVSKSATTYDKRHFYDLVKLYHPDTHDHQSNSSSEMPSASSSSSSTSSHVSKLPHATRLERYRMIVAANELLSNSSKRRMYDNYGLGWSHGDGATSLRDIDKNWRHQQGTAANNATWEDWENWRDAQAGKAGEPVFMSHGAFATIVVMFCLVGAIAQTNRAENSSTVYAGWVVDQNNNVGRRLQRNEVMVAGLNKDERVNHFLRERENVNYQFVPDKFESTDPSRPL